MSTRRSGPRWARILLPTLSGFLVWCGTAVAASPQPKVLGEVVVTATPETEAEPAAADRSAFVTTVDPKPYQQRLSSLPEVLEQTTGTTIRRFGGLGSYATASIRGSSAEQVTVLLDGVPLNRAGSAAVNLSNIPLANVERIEVYRGTAPLRFRSSSIGGVINIVTKKAASGFSHEGSASYGSFNTYDVNALTSGKTGRWSYLLSADAAGSKGDFEFRDDNGTPLNPSDDRTTRRENNDFASQDLLLKGSYQPSPSLTLDLTDDFFHKDEGVPGTGSNQSDSARLRTRRNILSLRASKTGFLSPELDGQAMVHLMTEHGNFEDREGEIGVGSQDNVNDTLEWGGDGTLTYFLGEHQAISVLGSFTSERFDSENRLADEDRSRDRRRTYQVGLEDEVSLWGDRLALTPQVLYTYLDNDFGGRDPFFGETASHPGNHGYASYKAGARFRLVKGLYLKGNAGRFYRFPTFSELFGDRGTVIGNPELKPERSLNRDLGISYEGGGWRPAPYLEVGRLHLEAAFFWNDVDDMIVYEQTGQRIIRADNVAAARLRGVELSWALDLWHHLSLTGNYTHQDAENTGEDVSVKGNQLPGRPRDQLFSRVELYNRWGKLFHEFDLIAENYLDSANIRKVSERRIHNLGVEVDPWQHASFTFEAKNVTDEQIADVLGFPLPGRSYFATLRMTF